MKNTYYGEIVRGNVGPVFKIYNGTFQKLGNFEADAYPIGTRITVTLEEPELPKERIVLPEGMKWDENALWFYGLPVAFIYEENSGWYRVPHQMVSRQVCFDNIEEGREVIENALSEHNYFGVRKVVDNE